MITLYSYPGLCGVADNNGYGLKVYAFLRLAGLPFAHEHIFDASAAPRGQLPYIVDGTAVVGDSQAIVAHVTARYGVTLDAELTAAQRDQDLMATRMLDDLYWVMSYSRWKDEAYWPQFRDLLMKEHANLTVEGLHKAQEFNAQRYYYLGVGRFTPAEAYARGLADLEVLGRLVPAQGYVHGSTPGVIDAAIYGFIANIYYLPIDTPLKRMAASRANLVRHCTQVHAAIA
jgi:glutathione S-transferase